MSVQDVKDTFYAALRDRIAANNPGRTLVVRGMLRPALLVAENELPTAANLTIPDAFTLLWTALTIDPQGAIKLTCELHYATAGRTGAAGMDRGRAMAAMDAELRAALGTAPQAAPLVSLAEIAGRGATTATAAGTRIFWSDAAFSPCLQRKERLGRTAIVEVFGYE